MRKAILIFCSVICLTTYSEVNANSNPSINSKENKSKKQIDLKGKLPATGAGTRSVFVPIMLVQNSTELEATFAKSLGMINILIYDASNNLVYQDFLDTSVEQQVYIDLTSLNKGNYSICFLNSENQDMSGNIYL